MGLGRWCLVVGLKGLPGLVRLPEKESVVHRLSWEQFDQLQATQPHLACAFHTAVMRWACHWVAVDINDGRRHHGSDRFMADIEG